MDGVWPLTTGLDCASNGPFLPFSPMTAEEAMTAGLGGPAKAPGGAGGKADDVIWLFLLCFWGWNLPSNPPPPQARLLTPVSSQ